MNEDGYGASDQEQELNDLFEMSQKISDLASDINADYCELNEKYGFNAVDILQELALTIDRKIEELRDPQTKEDYDEEMAERWRD